MHRNLVRLVLTVAALGYSLISAGQEGAVLEEVVVTAQKRAENVQDVPIAITAVDSQFLQDSSINNVEDMFMYVPGLSGRSASETESVFAIRGIGTNAFSASSDASVAVFVDEIYQGHPIIAGPPFFDVERIEVVKGPQGTLFGRNTSAGAISIIAKKADRQEMYVDTLLGLGNKGQQEIQAIGNFSNSDTQGVRIGVRASERDGTVDNTLGQELNKEDSIFARLNWDADWSDIVSTALLVDYYQSDATYGLVEFDPANRDAAIDNATVTQGEPPAPGNVDSDTLRAGFRVEVGLSDSLTLTSLTSLVSAELEAIPFDADSTPLDILQFHEPWDFEYLSQDLRINGNTDSTDWFIGLNVRDEQVSANTELQYNDEDVFLALLGDTCSNLAPVLMLPPGSCITNAVEPSIADADNFSWSVYGDVAWHFSDRATLTVGGRFSFDDKKVTLNTPFANTATALATGDNLLEPSTLGPISNEDDWTDFSPRIALDYALTDDVNLYGSVGAGYKTGGFNSAPDTPIGQLMPGQTQKPLVFEPEQSIAYEFGVKSILAGGRARVNAAAFFIDYEDYQLESVVGLNFLINNLDAENFGMELETNVLLTDYLQLIFNYSYIDSEVTSGSVTLDAVLPPVDVTGQRLPYAPENSYTLILDWTSPISDNLELQLRGELASQDEMFFQLPADDVVFQRDHDVVNVRLGLGSVDGRWDVAIAGENISDERWFDFTGLVLTPLGVPNIGDLWRAEFRYRFGGS